MASVPSFDTLNGVDCVEVTPDEIRAAFTDATPPEEIAEKFPDGLGFITHSLFLMTKVPPADALHECVPLCDPMTEQERLDTLAAMKIGHKQLMEVSRNEVHDMLNTPRMVEYAASMGLTLDEPTEVPPRPAFAPPLTKVPIIINDEDDPAVVTKIIRDKFAAVFVPSYQKTPVTSLICVSPKALCGEAFGSNPRHVTLFTTIPVPLKEGFLDTLRDPIARQDWKPVRGNDVRFYHGTPAETPPEGPVQGSMGGLMKEKSG